MRLTILLSTVLVGVIPAWVSGRALPDENTCVGNGTLCGTSGNVAPFQDTRVSADNNQDISHHHQNLNRRSRSPSSSPEPQFEGSPEEVTLSNPPLNTNQFFFARGIETSQLDPDFWDEFQQTLMIDEWVRIHTVIRELDTRSYESQFYHRHLEDARNAIKRSLNENNQEEVSPFHYVIWAEFQGRRLSEWLNALPLRKDAEDATPRSQDLNEKWEQYQKEYNCQPEVNYHEELTWKDIGNWEHLYSLTQKAKLLPVALLQNKDTCANTRFKRNSFRINCETSSFNILQSAFYGIDNAKIIISENTFMVQLVENAPNQKTPWFSELRWLAWLKISNDYSNKVDELQGIMIQNVRGESGNAVVEHVKFEEGSAHAKKGRAKFVRVLPGSKYWYRLIGSDNLRGWVRMLMDHHGELGKYPHEVVVDAVNDNWALVLRDRPPSLQ